MANPLCHFEFMSNDPTKCKQFYGAVFEWDFDDSSMPGYTLIGTGAEPGGGLMERPPEAPGPAMNVYFLVDDILETLEKVRAAGGTVLVEKSEIPSIGWWAFVADPEGIPFGIYQSAKP